jgi:serine protease
VFLDAGASSDSDGSIATWSWLQTDGPTVDLQGAQQPQASFVAPLPSVPTELVFRITVTDNAGSSTFDSVRITVNVEDSGARYQLSGSILPPLGQDLDGDTNDPNNRLLSNDDPLQAQPIGNPTTVGGYVNEAGRGASGRSFASGDPEDFFEVDLLAGQRISLLVADFVDADADLYLYSPDGELIDFSIETGEVEELLIPESGRYLVNVSIFSGASNYTLAVGATLGSSARPAGYRDVLPWQSVVTWDRSADAQPRLQEDLNQRWETRQLGGDTRRERLLALESRVRDVAVLRERLGRQVFRRSQFADPALQARWETLVSIKRLARQPGVLSAEPNYRVRPTAAVNDAAYPFQWHYPLINLPGAWDTSTGSPDVVVAVVDTGILGAHPDLQGQIVDGYDFVRDARAAGDGDGIDPNPEETVGSGDLAATNFHGSHVAGTVAARGNNSIGVAGVAYGVGLMPVRALTRDGGTSYDVLQSVRYAAGLPNDSGRLPARRADIINLSLGGSGFSQVSQNLYNDLRSLGIAVVAAAGNEGSSLPSYPAAYDNVISVSAVDARQAITSYSNRGSSIDVAAPGGDGRRDVNGDGYPDGVLSTGGADGDFAYTFLSGTSMAAPHVAGVLALMKSVNPSLDAADMERLLVDGRLTDDLGQPGRDDLYGYGLINAQRAVEAALAEAGQVSDANPRLGSSTATLSFGSTLSELEFTLSNTGGGELGGVQLSVDQPWLRLTPVLTDANGLGRYRASVDRGALAPGVYEGGITAVAASNSLAIRVLVGVTNGEDAELGTVYLLLFDPVADRVVAQADIFRDAGGYRYTLTNIPPGSYEVFAGTDLDNDLLICDAGEACGAFLTIEDPLLLRVEGDREQIDFAIEYLVALPGAAADTAAARAPLSLRRAPERTP